jgi:eukaryotic-like serine/threonine-protein kinase
VSGKRAPSPPPLIAGFEHLSLIGSGGFSDVFLYQQQRPRRRVAVKVLLNEWSSESQRTAFDAEADLMATLSTHPSIVTMYEAGVAADGRPYLAMEHCSRPNLGARYRSERLSVAETLRIAVQIAGAVETAHRAGILHRDIKPANILVTDYGHPALTDFGISSTVDDATRAEGMSIPWSPPESFAETPWAGKETDVWALAATTYTLLAGRAPFELPGGSNSSASLITRIEATPLLPTGRTDVPGSLERVLGVAMAKNPAARYPTMLAFARALQQVQTELSYAVTPIDVLADMGLPHDEEPDDDGGTRLRAMVSIDPRGPSGPAPAPRGGDGGLVGGAALGAVPVVASQRAAVAPHPYSGGGGAPVDAAASASWSARPTASSGHAPDQSRSAVVLSPGLTAAPRPWEPADVGDTLHRVETAQGGPDALGALGTPARAPRRPVWPLLGGAGVLVVVVAAIVALLPDAVPPEADGPGTSVGDGAAQGPNDNLGDLVSPVGGLAGQYDVEAAAAVFTWEAPADGEPGDSYVWERVDVTKETPPTVIEAVDLPLTVAAGATESVCVEVRTVRDGRPSEPSRECVNP